MSMTIDEVIAAKREAEMAIAGIIAKFNRLTGLRVDSLRGDPIATYIDGSATYKVELECRL